MWEGRVGDGLHRVGSCIFSFLAQAGMASLSTEEPTGRQPVWGLFRAVFVRELEEGDVLPVCQVQSSLGSGLADDGGEGSCA